jgi:CDP-diacylglycerol---glycerol-3-phosphate 3-phosphatidyltransferase
MLTHEQLKGLITHPNTLTLARVAAVPVVVVLMLHPTRIFSFFAAILFSVASITDFFDGYLARRRGLESTFGKVMDPLADKLLVSSAFIMLASLGWASAWIVCIIIGRELAITGLRNLIAESGQDLSASKLGKYKTGFQIAAIIPLLIHYPIIEIDFQQIGGVFLWLALVLTVWSGVDYFIRFRRLLQL